MANLMHLFSNPTEIASGIGQNVLKLRLAKNLSRKTLAQRSGVSESSIKRFETSGTISLSSLILLAIALDEITPVAQLFQSVPPRTIEELNNRHRQRGTR
ncbi:MULTISPECIES: helix-turn-helix domain-containing protein [Pantoea]|uniref:Helix-turn-helix transcriptional regulator n=1 Tax=Candidatus Pantoea multigeneris TaxID=2608357 RepID=A0ABX0RJP5_9GAMM|nr:MULTISPECIES: helix-turn-helix transcriptional regulator [Pantoea]NIF24348.1 helix-turn-helix transcriptional regulator [Pantoea multigeneris]